LTVLGESGSWGGKEDRRDAGGIYLKEIKTRSEKTYCRSNVETKEKVARLGGAIREEVGMWRSNPTHQRGGKPRRGQGKKKKSRTKPPCSGGKGSSRRTGSGPIVAEYSRRESLVKKRRSAKKT